MEKIRTGAIVQARLSSSRLPKKVLLPLAGKPVLWHVLNRLQYCRNINTVVLATSEEKEDRQLKKIADELNIPTFFGSLNDVLSRYYHAARKYRLDNVVRITADCPVIDPGIVDEVVEKFIRGGYDYYGLDGQFPDGLDVTVYSFRALETAFNEAKLPSEREHVGGTAFFRKNGNRFRTGGYKKFRNRQNFRWTLDEARDYEFIKRIYDELYGKNRIFTYKDIFKLLEKEPDLTGINSDIVRNEGYLKSLKADQLYLKKREK
jgi:spore coat polysaccharide biosynthesis protein SpsF